MLYRVWINQLHKVNFHTKKRLYAPLAADSKRVKPTLNRAPPAALRKVDCLPRRNEIEE